MELVAMSGSGISDEEVAEAVKMLDAGLTHFHIRKPRVSRKEMKDYLLRYPEEYRNRLVLHSFHGLASDLQIGGIHLSRSHRKRNRIFRIRLRLKRLLKPQLIITRSFHKLTSLTADKRNYSYAFLSPVFDGVSENTLGSGYSKRALLITLPQARCPIFAMGGVKPQNLREVAESGFSGALLAGALWRAEQRPHEVYEAAREIAEKISGARFNPSSGL